MVHDEIPQSSPTDEHPPPVPHICISGMLLIPLVTDLSVNTPMLLNSGLEPRVIDGHQWYKNDQYLFYEDRIVVPEARLDGCLQWSHLSPGHNGANRSVDFFREYFYSGLTLTELRSYMQTIVDACGCHASKQSDSRDRGIDFQPTHTLLY